MNTKRYRATTMREALEQVRHELGDDALVLDTKKVRAGGILGLGKRDMVEVRVTADDASRVGTEMTSKAESREWAGTSNSFLNLHDDSFAAPSTEFKSATLSNVAAYSALAARAGARESTKTSSASSIADGASTSLPLQTVELADTAPRIVHRPVTPSAPRNTPGTLSIHPPVTDSEASTAVTSTRIAPASDLEHLHAELREMKFTLGKLTARSLAGDSLLSPHALASDSSEADAELYDSPFYEAYMELNATGLSPEVARRFLRNKMRTSVVTSDTDPIEFAHRALLSGLEENVQFAEENFDSLLPLGSHAQPLDFNSPLVFIGPTGVGKTTTIAKLAAHIALRQRRRVELITLDTYRIAAVEQLKTYAEIIGAGCHVASSVVELNALANRFSGDAAVLVDTTGRSPHDLADQLELADYLRASDDFLKCLVLPATTHATDAQIAVRKFGLYGANRLTLTKLDETSRPGAAIEVAMEAELPLLYLCAGQRVPEDLERASADRLAARVLRRS